MVTLPLRAQQLACCHLSARAPTHYRPARVTIRKVWIEQGCILCNLCMDTVPDVFLVTGEEGCVVKPEAAAHFAQQGDEIRQAASDCPVEVIKIEE